MRWLRIAVFTLLFVLVRNLVADESGVVVIPRERAYEIARRAHEVKKNEERIREEIRRGSTLSRISDLIKWEKRVG